MTDQLKILTIDEWLLRVEAVPGILMNPDDVKSLIDNAPIEVSSAPHDENFFSIGRFSFEWVDRMGKGEHVIDHPSDIGEAEPVQIYYWLKGFYEKSIESKIACESVAA